MRMNITEQQKRNRKRKGRETINVALIILLCVATMVEMLGLGAGTAVATPDSGNCPEYTTIDANANLDNMSFTATLPSAENVIEKPQPSTTSHVSDGRPMGQAAHKTELESAACDYQYLDGNNYEDSGGDVKPDTIYPNGVMLSESWWEDGWAQYRFYLPAEVSPDSYTYLDVGLYGQDTSWIGSGVDIYVYNWQASNWDWVGKSDKAEGYYYWTLDPDKYISPTYKNLLIYVYADIDDCYHLKYVDTTYCYEEPASAWIYDLWIENAVDKDGDGYYRCFDLYIDADTDADSLDVFASITPPGVCPMAWTIYDAETDSHFLLSYDADDYCSSPTTLDITVLLFDAPTNTLQDEDTISVDIEPASNDEPPVIELTPSSHNFGEVEKGNCSSEKSFTLRNKGEETATGSVYLTGTHAGQFTITQGSGSFSLGAGATKTIKVKFCPTSTGSKSATLFVDGSNCNDASSSLSGTGAPHPPEIELTPSSHNFGEVEKGNCSSEKSFTLRNKGEETATGSVYLTGTHAGQFTITQGSGSFSLGAGATKTIKVKFCPTSTGSKSATLFVDGSNCNDASSSLSGTGVEEIVHDLSIVNTISPPNVIKGHNCIIDVIVSNEGSQQETDVPVVLKEGDTPIAVTQYITLASGEEKTLYFEWDTAGSTEGTHTLTATIGPVAGETDTDDNSQDITITILPYSECKTIFITNYDEFEKYWPKDEVQNLKHELSFFACGLGEKGIVIDVSKDMTVKQAYDNWVITDPDSANDVANAVDNLLDNKIDNLYSNTHYVIIVGDDRIIPFYRVEDDSCPCCDCYGSCCTEEDYYYCEQAISDTSSVGSSIKENYYLTDNL